jgi:hypothetical protein
MPRKTDHQQMTDALLDAFIVQMIAEVEIAAYRAHSDSESDTSLSSNDGVTDTLLESLAELHRTRYQGCHRDIPKTTANMCNLLDVYKHQFPDIFRSFLRMSPDCFGHLVTSIQHHPVFYNNSNHVQMSIEEQLAIALYCFGHYGNAAYTMKVALWAGVGYGTVKLVTTRVMTAICDQQFRRATMPWSDPIEIESAKAWVEGHSCPAWRDGWLMVDGTLVPLFQWPHHHGNTFFDRKSNYSLNVQAREIVSPMNILMK